MSQRVTLGEWCIEFQGQCYTYLIIKHPNYGTQCYDLLKEPYCRKCAFPRSTNECTWHRYDQMNRTYAIGIYYPRRNAKHSNSLLSQHIYQLKFSKEYAIPLGLSIALLIKQCYKELLDVDMITFVPKHIDEYKKDQRSGTKYNQAEELANIIGRYIKKRVEGLLIKSQTYKRGNTWEERMRIPDCIYHISQDISLESKKILLVDDVRTSGGTANKCTNVLKAHGAKEVYLFVAGRDIGDSS